MSLIERNDYLTEENRQLREMLKTPNFVVPDEWKLSRCEKNLLGSLYASRYVRSKATLLAASKIKADADEKLIEVRVSLMRKKLRAFGIEIKNVWGEGYILPEASRAIIKGALK